jgi:crotonobetainyl-CoA:carnitine CoA-transferase CaiB-like acyl-CoA transferase
MARPLEGITIADFSHVMAGPYASRLLCLLGATVIKIEEPGRGDAMRYYGDDRRYDGMSPAFIAVNAGKKSIALNLKDAADLETARRIVTQADVVLENFRPGVMKRLGLDYETCKSLNTDIIYCSVSGYGQSASELRDWPAIDNIVQATSGMMSLGGESGDPPVRVGFPVVDTLTGQTAAFAILSALLRKERNGGGEFIDVAMLDSTIAFMTSAIVPFLITGKALKRTGNVGYSGQPTSGLFEAGDGRVISLGVVQQRQFAMLARHLKREDWLDDPRFSDPDLRRKNSDELHEEVSIAIKQKSALEWESEMSAVGIPCGVVREVSEAAMFPHLAERGAKLKVSVPGIPQPSDVEIVNAGFLMSSDGPFTDQPPPRLNEHEEDIRSWLRQQESGPVRSSTTGK